jgi:Domain of unknown function (DUF4277)
VEKLLGALPVVASFCRRLDLAGIVDRACPVREVATLTHGQVIEVLVANRLTSPTPLRRVEDWARAWAVEEVFAIPPEALNDDRIGRALDAIAPELEQLVGSVGARAISTFGLEVARLHWDMTVRHEVRVTGWGERTHPRAVAAAWVKLGAACPGRRQGGWEQPRQRRGGPGLPDGSGSASKAGRCNDE